MNKSVVCIAVGVLVGGLGLSAAVAFVDQSPKAEELQQAIAAENEPIRTMLVDYHGLGVTLNLALRQEGVTDHFVLEGKGSDVSGDHEGSSIHVVFRLTAHDDNDVVNQLGDGVFSMSGSSGQLWFLLAIPGEQPDTQEVIVIDGDGQGITLNVVAPSSWAIDGQSPSLGEAILTLLVECDPTFQVCDARAKKACEPHNYQLDYSCNPETGEVHCSWTCFAAGLG
ncbi:MAG: hypothetical protein IIA64_04570 [Planctomycetes bacterium]|nr:hypothetical protein [Planctomycetota bacterium]